MLNTLLSVTPKDIYVILQVIGIVILVGELLYVSFQKPSELRKHLVFILLTLTISFIGYYVELIANNYQTAYIGICIGYAGKPFALFASLLLLLDYTNIKLPKWITISILLFFLALTTLVFTNEMHHLYYGQLSFNIDNRGSPITIDQRGPFWYVYMASSFTIFAAYAVVVGYEFKRSRNKQAKHMAILLLMVVLFSILGLIAFIANITYNYDTTLMGILIGCIFLLILFTRYQLFSSLTLAQQRTLNDSDNGYVVLDARMQVSFSNKVAQKIIPELNKNGIKNEAISIDKLSKYRDGEIVFFQDNVYKIKIHASTIGRKNKTIGLTVNFLNITEHYNYQEKLNSDINEATSRIAEIQRSAMISFANIVEARDGNTGEHIKNVSEIAKNIAISLSFKPKYQNIITSKFISMIEQCAPLHDLGKIFIPDAILLKPGKLTPNERVLMQTHAEKGAIMIETGLGQIEEKEFLKMSKDIACYHHEWFNGTGYPKKLKGKKIPLVARIVAVADVYDALRQERSYKKALSKNDSIAIIVQERGTHFDPEIVDAFLEIIQNLK